MNTTRIFYIRDKRGFPIGTIASQKVLGLTDQTPFPTPMVIFSLSVYNKNDKFDKAEGRKDATQKLLDGTIVGAVFASGDVKDNILYHLSRCTCVPEKISKAAGAMLKQREGKKLVDDILSTLGLGIGVSMRTAR